MAKKLSNKVEKIEPIQTVDESKLTDSNSVEAIVDSKHMKKGVVYHGVGADSAAILINRGLAKLV